MTPTSPANGLAVHVAGFGMDFGARTVIRDLSFDVGPGETFGLLGSNGSGKTTTLRALLGIQRASAGTLHIDGRPFTPEDGGRVGYLPEERGLYRKETVLTVMTYFGELKGMARDKARAWSLAYLDRVGLADKAKTRIDRLSGGQQQKVQLGVTIMSGPGLLILDEPTKGFDPVNRKLLFDIIGEQKQAGSTIVLVSHQMDDVEELCDRVLLLKDGAAEAYGSLADIQHRHGSVTGTLTFAGTLPEHRAYRILQTLPAVTPGECTAQLSLADGVKPAELLSYLIGTGLQVSSFSTARTSLEEIFLRVYGAEPILEGAL